MTDLILEAVRLAIDLHRDRGEDRAAAELEAEVERLREHNRELRARVARAEPIIFRAMPRDMATLDVEQVFAAIKESKP